MDPTSRAGQLAAIRSFSAKLAGSVLFDEGGESLMDALSGKAIPIDAGNLVSVEQRTKEGTGEPYLLLTYGDGRQLALADVGIAFAPDTRNTGELTDLPPVVCFRDYATLLGRLKHELFGHADREPARGTVALVMSCLAILDGARHLGFDVGREERELETHLEELEKRSAPPTRIP